MSKQYWVVSDINKDLRPRQVEDGPHYSRWRANESMNELRKHFAERGFTVEERIIVAKSRKKRDEEEPRREQRESA